MALEVQQRFNSLDVRITRWMARYGIVLLRISVGINFFWFGILKYFPNLSPAEALATGTIELLSFGLVPPPISLPILATWEVLIGLGLIFNRYMRATLLLLLFQMMGTITPLFLFPDLTFTRFPYAPTLEGQYILKNMVLIAAGIVIGATVRGGAVIADPADIRPGSRSDV